MSKRLISAPSLGIYYCQQLTLSVCPDVPLSVRLSRTHAPSNCFFFFVSRWNRAILAVSSPCAPLQNCIFFDFWFRPPKAQNLLPKISTKSPVSRLVWMADRPEMFGPIRGFSEMADSMEPCKMLWADPCCHDNEIWARRGDPVAYRLVTSSGEPDFNFLCQLKML